MKRRSLILHIGLEKTGTTSLQRFCTDNTALLVRHGIDYPARNRGFGVYNHGDLAAAYLQTEHRDFALSTSRATKKTVVASVIADIGRSATPTVLISAEHLSSRFDTGMIEELLSDFGDFEPRVAVALRDARSRLISSYSTYVVGGGVLGLDDYAAQMVESDASGLRIESAVGRWERLLGKDKIDLIDYDSSNDIVPAFFKIYAPSFTSCGSQDSYREKISWPPFAVEALRLVNQAVMAKQSRTGAHLYVWMQRRYFQRAIARRIEALLDHCPRGEWRLSEQARAAVDELAEKDRRWLQTTFGFTLSRGSCPYATAASDQDRTVPLTSGALARILVDMGTGWRWPLSDAILSLALLVDRCRRHPFS